MIEHQIQVSDVKPIRKTLYGVPYALRQEMQDQVQKMLDKNLYDPQILRGLLRRFWYRKRRAQTENLSTGSVLILYL